MSDESPDLSNAVSLYALRKMVLDHISSGEASSYNTLYGGGTFSGYGDHPRQRFALPGGSTTSAAGKYQFQEGTWDDEAKRLGLSDFSPASQDAAAWDLAQRTYMQQTGRSLVDDAERGKISWGALGSQWSSLSGNRADAGTAPSGPDGTSVASAAAASPMPSGMAGMNGLQAMQLLQSLAPHLTFTPVDYDPFAVEKSNA